MKPTKRSIPRGAKTAFGFAQRCRRRIFSPLLFPLLLALLCGSAAPFSPDAFLAARSNASVLWAADEAETTAPSEALLLRFTEIEAEMKKNSPILKANAANREVLRYLRSKIADSATNANQSFVGINQLSNYLYQLRQSLGEQFDPAINPAVTPSELALKGAVDGVLSVVGGQISGQMNQLSELSRNYASGGEMAVAINQLHDADLQAVALAQGYYQQCFQAERELQLLKAQEDLYRQQQQAIREQYELGLATETQLQILPLRIDILIQQQALIERERDSIRGELNLLLGRPAGAELVVQPLEFEMELIAAIDPEAAWQAVYKESYALKGKKQMQGSLSEQDDETRRRFGESGIRAQNSGLELQAARLETQLLSEQLRLRFEKSYRQLQQQAEIVRMEELQLRLEEQLYAQMEERYAAGLVSRLTLQEQQLDLLTKTQRYAQLWDELALSYHRWLLIEKGMSIA